MSRLIDAKKYERDLLKAYDDVSMEFDVLDKQPTVDAIIIPKGATNGDVIKALFPNEKIIETRDTYMLCDTNGTVRIIVYKEVWNAPYKVEERISNDR